MLACACCPGLAAWTGGVQQLPRPGVPSVLQNPPVTSPLSTQRISIPQPDFPSEARTFSFYLSNIGRDSPQGSFDCIQQYVSR